jgi:hypothetical protein
LAVVREVTFERPPRSNKGHSNATWRLSAVREQLSDLLRHSSRFTLLGTSFTARWRHTPALCRRCSTCGTLRDQQDAAPDNGDQDTRRVEAAEVHAAFCDMGLSSKSPNGRASTNATQKSAVRKTRGHSQCRSTMTNPAPTIAAPAA